MMDGLLFDPLVPWPAVWGILTLVVVVAVIALWRGLAGWSLRLLA